MTCEWQKMQLGAGAAPTCGRRFLALLSNGVFCVAGYPENVTGYHDYYVIDGHRVPVPSTIEACFRRDFLQIVSWWELPEQAVTGRAVGVMRDSAYSNNCAMGDM